MEECPRITREALERQMLSPSASFAQDSKGRRSPEPECFIRTCYQRDIDRIIHSKAFRRLKHKTQVFLQPEGDHYRTRLTHTFEVARIARTVARGLRLNEDLTEAIALGHDLGHPPFGHAGERALDEIFGDDGGFQHNVQSLRIVERIERDGTGLNLTQEVRNGILCHTGALKPDTQEGAVVRIADRIAYINHDVDDAVRAGILRETAIPEEVACALGESHSKRINTLIRDMIAHSAECGEISLSPQIAFVFDSFYEFMFAEVYRNMKAKSEETKVFGILNGIIGYYVDNPDKLPDDYRRTAMEEGLLRAVCDYTAGMTDKYAVDVYEKLFVPEAWQVR